MGRLYRPGFTRWRESVAGAQQRSQHYTGRRELLIGIRFVPVTIASHASGASRSTQVYEFFDDRILGHLWFIAVCDGESVQMLVPTFRSERSAHIFEYCYHNYPGAYLLSIDGQLELARRIERAVALESIPSEIAVKTLCEGLSFEWPVGRSPA